MKSPIINSQFDTRTVERTMREKKLTPKEVSDYLKSLPDESKNAEEVRMFDEEKKAPSKRLTFAPGE